MFGSQSIEVHSEKVEAMHLTTEAFKKTLNDLKNLNNKVVDTHASLCSDFRKIGMMNTITEEIIDINPSSYILRSLYFC